MSADELATEVSDVLRGHDAGVVLAALEAVLGDVFHALNDRELAPDVDERVRLTAMQRVAVGSDALAQARLTLAGEQR